MLSGARHRKCANIEQLEISENRVEERNGGNGFLMLRASVSDRKIEWTFPPLSLSLTANWGGRDPAPSLQLLGSRNDVMYDAHPTPSRCVHLAPHSRFRESLLVSSASILTVSFGWQDDRFEKRMCLIATRHGLQESRFEGRDRHPHPLRGRVYPPGAVIIIHQARDSAKFNGDLRYSSA